jgi:hypothetical protein
MSDAEKRAYDNAHTRVVRLWGKACLYPCINCGRRARDWAYDGTDPTGQGIKRRYSIWPEFYMPMCHKCHMRLDGPRGNGFRDVGSPEPTCGVHGCPNDQARRGMCWMHYKRWLKYRGTGPAGWMGKKAPLDERFITHVRLGPGPCYIWTGYVHKPSGFGALVKGHRFIYVHRYAWEREYGPIPLKARVIQVCGNRLCVRADHLELRGRGIGSAGAPSA